MVSVLKPMEARIGGPKAKLAVETKDSKWKERIYLAGLPAP
jgi:hypothetical protein